MPAVVSDALPQIQLPSAPPPPPDPGLPKGPGGWAWDTAPTAPLIAHPSDYIWTLSGPCGPRPRPCLLPRHTGRRWAGPRSSRPIHGHVPSWMPGTGPRGRGKIPSERPRASLCSPWDQRRCLHPPCAVRSSLPLKGHASLAGPSPRPGRGYLERALRPSPSYTEAPGCDHSPSPPSPK